MGMTYFVGAVAAAYLVVVGALYVFQRHIMYYPMGEMPQPASAGVGEMEAVRARTADGLELTGWLAEPADADRPVVVLFHGNAGHIGDRAFKARPFLDAGYGVYLVEYRGYGGNPGSPSEEGLYADGRAAFEVLRGRGLPPARWVLYGESLGSGVAVHLAGELARAGEPVAAVVLEAPFTSMGEAAATHYPWVPARTLVRDRYDSLGKIDAIGARLLVVHGTADEVVPVEQGRRLYAAAAEPKQARWIDGAGHNDLFSHDAVRIILEFLQNPAASGDGD